MSFLTSFCLSLTMLMYRESWLSMLFNRRFFFFPATRVTSTWISSLLTELASRISTLPLNWCTRVSVRTLVTRVVCGAVSPGLCVDPRFVCASVSPGLRYDSIYLGVGCITPPLSWCRVTGDFGWYACANSIHKWTDTKCELMVPLTGKSIRTVVDLFN